MIKVSPGVVLVRLLVEEKTASGIIMAPKKDDDSLTQCQEAEILEIPEVPEREDTSNYTKGDKVIISQDSKRGYKSKEYGECMFINEDSIMGKVE